MRILILLLFLTSSCVPAIIVGGVMANSSSKKTRSKWNQEFIQTNLEREKAGLKPLDWCEEAFKVNEGWAKDDKACKAKLKEQGKI